MKIFGKSQKNNEKKDASGNGYVTYRVVDKRGNVIYEGKVKGKRFNGHIKENLQKGILPGIHTGLSEKPEEQMVRDSER